MLMLIMDIVGSAGRDYLREQERFIIEGLRELSLRNRAGGGENNVTSIEVQVEDIKHFFSRQVV